MYPVTGQVVYLLDETRNPIIDIEGNPCLYQISAVYRSSGKVGLVTDQGDYIGTHLMKDIHYASGRPLFCKEDYEVGTPVIWVDYEDIYEGIIESLNETTAQVGQIKKVLPVDYKLRIPYWKIPEGRKSNQESTPLVPTNKIGDDL